MRAVPYVLKHIPDAKFIFVGSDCGMKPYLFEKIKQYKIHNHVEFIDHLSRQDLVNYYQQSKVCVVPSLWENHPYVILEAFACAKPVIASKVGGIPGILKDNLNGILVPAGSSLKLAQAIVTMLNNNELQLNSGINNRKFIEDNFSSSIVAEKILKIYNEVLNNGSL